jgi:hypothetical protein
MVLQIAHQVSEWPVPVRSEDPIPSSKKFSMGPCRASIPLPFPPAHAGSCLVGRDAMPSADGNARERDAWGESETFDARNPSSTRRRPRMSGDESRRRTGAPEVRNAFER